MSESTKERYIMIREDALPDVYRKVLDVKEKLANQAQLSVNQACKESELSRSAFYKYRDMVYPYNENKRKKAVAYIMHAEIGAAMLSRLGEILHKHRAEILQFAQDKEKQVQARIFILLLCHDSTDPNQIREEFQRIRGVSKVDCFDQ